MNEDVTSVVGTSYASARPSLTCCGLDRSSSWSVCTRTPVVADGGDLDDRVGHDRVHGVDREARVDVPSLGLATSTRNCDPPRNSMPKLKPAAKSPPPRMNGTATAAITSSAAMREPDAGACRRSRTSACPCRGRCRDAGDRRGWPSGRPSLVRPVLPRRSASAALRSAIVWRRCASRLAPRPCRGTATGVRNCGPPAVDGAERLRVEPAERMAARRRTWSCASSCSIGCVNSTTMSTSMMVVRPRVNAKPCTLPTARMNRMTAASRLTALGREDRADGALPAGLDGADQPSAVAQLVADSFEVDDERVGREADRDDEARDAGEREAVALAPRQDRDHQVGEHRRDDERRDRDRGRAAGTGRASRSRRGCRPMRPAMRPAASCAVPSVAEIVSVLCTVKLIGSAPNLSWSASAFDALLGEAAGDLRLAVGDGGLRGAGR